MFLEKVYEDCQQQAIYLLATDQEYLKTKNEEKKQAILEAQMCRCYFSRMNLTKHYFYQENMKDEGTVDAYDSESGAGMLAAQDDDREEDMDAQVYSKEWNGTFSKREIEYLDGYYKQLEQDFVFSTVNMRDLDADNAYNRYRSGNGTLDEYKKAMELFDKLSKSVEFTECERRAADTGGAGSFGEWVAMIENQGYIEIEGEIPWEQDKIDAIINDFRHVLVACGLDGDM